MPQNLGEKEKIAFIMLKIAEDRSFSEHYYWGDAATSRKMYSKAMDPKDVKLENKRKLICVTASRLFKYIATELGLEVCYVGEEGYPISTLTGWLKNGEHVYPAAKLSDGTLIKCDIQRDLPNIQTGCRWKFFGSAELGEKGILAEITQEELDTIMEEIGYFKNRVGYTDDYCRRRISEIDKPVSVTELVGGIFQDERLSREAEHTNIVETYKFYMKVMEIYLSEECRDRSICRKTLQLTRYIDRFFMFPCKMKKDGITRYTLCAYTHDEEDEETIYLLSRTRKKMLPITLEEMSFFEEQGLKFPSEGTKHLRKKLKAFRKENVASRQTRMGLQTDLEQFVDESADEMDLIM